MPYAMRNVSKCILWHLNARKYTLRHQSEMQKCVMTTKREKMYIIVAKRREKYTL